MEFAKKLVRDHAAKHSDETIFKPSVLGMENSKP